MTPVRPTSPEELAGLLQEAAANSHSISVIGNDTKRQMAGLAAPANVVLSTARLNRILQYEPNDLTISVEAGMRWSDLQAELGRHGQMIALDPPFAQAATVGGVIASNASGPQQAGFGTARDLVIGMQFAMLDGKLVRTGGMVVKNVAGLDMGKLMIGSFGTLAVMTSVNFRLHAVPAATNTFLLSFTELAAAIEARDAIVRGVLRPLAVDLTTPAAAARLGQRGYLLAIRAGGSGNVLDRYARELKAAARLSGSADEALWSQIREFTADFLRRQPSGVVLRVSTPIAEVGTLLALLSGPCIARAASGVSYAYFSNWQQIAAVWPTLSKHRWPAVVEFAPDDIRESRRLWLSPDPSNESGFAMMKRVKQMFDPESLLNRSRLYGCI